MYRIDKPIVAAVRLDESATEVLRQAVEMARHYQVKLHVCHVLPDLLSVRPLFPHLQLENALRLAEFEAAARGALYSRVAAFVDPDGDDCELLVECGTAHSAILRAAERIGAGLIVVGHGSPGQMLSGTPERVVRYAHCPVLVARPAAGGCVLAATDFSDPATPAVEAAASEAKRRARDLVIIHAIDIVRSVLAPDATMPDLPPIDLLDEVRQASRERLDSYVAQFTAQGNILTHGPAETAILEATKSLPADLVVVGTHGRTGMGRLALGSVAEAVVREAGCSTLVVRLNS
jgi:nucleotide-binding universal stress UspA family protein